MRLRRYTVMAACTLDDSEKLELQRCLTRRGAERAVAGRLPSRQFAHHNLFVRRG